jgi:hypothetical protein
MINTQIQEENDRKYGTLPFSSLVGQLNSWELQVFPLGVYKNTFPAR